MDFAATLQSLKSVFMSKPELMQQYPDFLSDLQKLDEYHQQLQFERDRLYSYIQNANDTIAVFDLEGRVIYTTDNWDRQLGYHRKDVLNQRVFEQYMHPDDAPQSQAFLDSVISSKEGKTGFQYRIRHVDGSWRWHMVSLSPILNEAGEVESVVAIARSIHDQKMAELKVRESERRMRILLDTMREGVVMVDVDDRIQYVNKSLCKTFGYTAEELLGKHGHQMLIIPEDQKTITEKIEARECGLADEYEVRGRKKNNELIWLRISDAPLIDEDGRVIGSVGIMTDITAKHKITNALIASEEKYRRLFEDSVAGVFQSSFEDKYLNVNKTFARMFGYDSPEAMVSSVTDIKNHYARPEEREVLKQELLNEGVVEDYELELKRVDGKPFWVSLYARLSKQIGGQLTMDGTCVDITESKSLKEQLLASQKMEAIGKLAGGVAHDFNNLLTVILGYTEDMLDDIAPGSPHSEPVEEIMKAGLKAANLTRQLLAFSRNQVILNQEISINNLINNLHGIISRLIGEEIEVQFQLNDDLAYVKADPGQIEQVLINMVINAKDAMPKGGKLRIRTSNQEVDGTYADFHPNLKIGKYVMLSISDTGIGMDQETLAHIFEPFFSTKENGKSSGLGLASAYGIIEQAGGVIMPYSEPGKGTIMKVLLPALQIRSGAAEADRTAASGRGKGQKILIVEDEDALCKILQKMLTNLGYKVECNNSSLLALKRFERGEKFDIVITDVVMPSMNGKDLADAIRRINPEQKMIYMSGFADDVIAQHGIIDPDLPFIQKPFSAKLIGPLISGLLAESNAKLKLLILDDEEGICKLFQRSCHKRGHECDKAGSPAEALALLSRNQYDMLLVDLNLGGVNGLDTIAEIRELGCKAPVILLSGMLQEGIFDRFESLGVLRAFEKSFDNTPILQYIESHLQGS